MAMVRIGDMTSDISFRIIEDMPSGPALFFVGSSVISLLTTLVVSIKLKENRFLTRGPKYDEKWGFPSASSELASSGPMLTK